MFRAGGCSSQVTRCIHLGKRPTDQASSLSPPNAVKVQSSVTGWNKQPLMQELTKALKSVSSDLLDRFIDSVYKFSEQPYLNEGNFGPVNEIGDEVFIDNLNGEVPKDFPEGVYIRNGPNPLNASQTAAESIFGPTSYMYYEGHGMLHAIYFSKSNLGEWRISYKNKYVDTDTFELERKKNKIAFLPSAEGEPYATLVAFLLNTVRFGKPVKDSANTSIFEHAGRAFAATENHLPYEIDINNLRTLGPYNINGAWDQPFTSHPKKICGSGELVTMGTNIEKPHYVLGVISSDGERLLHKVDLKFEEGKLIHDIGVTAQYNIIMDYPLHFGLIRTILRKPFIQNDMGGISRIGVMPRFGDADSIIWFDVENHCSYHLFNCFEDGNEVVIRGCRTLDSVLSSASHDDDKSKCSGRAFLQPDKNSEGFDPSVDGTLFSRPYEWRLNLKSGTTKEGYLTDEKVAMDFPVINEDFVGVKNNYGYAQVVDSVATSEIGLFKYNRIAKVHFDRQDKENKQLKSVEYHVLKEKTFCSGVQFVAKENGIDEDDGWIITYVHDELTNVSQVYIIDAKRFAEEPVLKITLPQRVPYGFHGNFFYK
ncbi:carotenoid 9,10(9',10')-cleavage dioxygenase 1-like [Oryza glaberrima]|uniref:carotenoid 9,10(9',10')-cleavage dioxygenase 1-like n=1 Tax=Oryza glaberrima TaxID=4538 RepID=UPI00224BEA16|nr:carotenoid 9,10(9',10')-cleavage dioxygenase 1-like [Oryza glaberrima]